MATTEKKLKDLINLNALHEAKQEEPHLKPTEEIERKLKIIHTDIQHDKIQKITISKEIFDQIKKSLQETVRCMEKNPSIFSRAAEFWGELPLWQKILGGVALTLPTLILGIAAHLGFLLAICGVTAITYAAGGIILDDHHKCSNSTVENLQKGVLELANLLELTITALDTIREQLAMEIQKFIDENARLKENIAELSKQIDAIYTQVTLTSRVNTQLSETKDGLVAVSDSFKIGVTMQTDLLKQNQEKLERITTAYTGNQRELAEKVLEIQKVRSELEEDLARAKGMIDTLHTAISQLSTSTLGSEEQRKAFQEKLDFFISNKEASFLLIADRICDAERKLALVQKELEGSNARYKQLLSVQEQHIDTLKILSGAENTGRTAAVSVLLGKNGLYASKQEPSPSSATESVLLPVQGSPVQGS